MFYTGGLPFHFTRKPNYHNSYAYAATHNIPGYVPSGYNVLRTTLLRKERANVERLLKPIKGSWLANGVSIVSDGWSNPQRWPLINIMAASDEGPMFIKAIYGSSEYPKIFWTPCIVPTLNLALKNICAAKNTEKNEVTYEECSWITRIADDASFIRVFIINHSMREDDVGKAQKVKDLILSDHWWDVVNYIIEFTTPNYDMLRESDINRPCLHLMYEMWDSMIENVKAVIYRHEGLEANEQSSFFNVVYDIFIDQWTKNTTPLRYLAHSLNPKYYSIKWLSENLNRLPPHQDHEISIERSKSLKQYFEDENELRIVKVEFATFLGRWFPSPGALTNR
ncbi:hypothetical protein SO802_029165 [Lithocarpus litseifolius]|uniref:DUF659 domain-containing protein n=1 Tax=Lithocarpus litseifolius TaxID=425828 RepID=A0AAW2BSV4_9ROSI